MCWPSLQHKKARFKKSENWSYTYLMLPIPDVYYVYKTLTVCDVTIFQPLPFSIATLFFLEDNSFFH